MAASRAGEEYAPLKSGEILDESDQRLISNIDEHEWIERAMKSKAAERIDEIFEPLVNRDFTWTEKNLPVPGVVTRETIEKLKREMFKQVYDTIGDEMMPEDIVRALVVKTERYHPWMVVLLTVLSLGLFYLFRPRDDEAVLVLTKNERISMYKVIRRNVFENLIVLAKATLYVAGVAVGLSFIPFWIIELAGRDPSQEGLEVLGPLGEKIQERILNNTKLQTVAWVCTVIWFIFWGWTKFPHDYGVRQRQTHAADKVCCTQYCLSHGKWSRTCRVRMYFGRFPDQGALDNSMTLRAGSVVTVANKESLAAASVSNPFAARSRRAMLIFALAVVNIFMLIDFVLTYIQPPLEWAKDGKLMASYCERPYPTKDECSPQHCKSWLEDATGSSLEADRLAGFCAGVQFLATQDPCSVVDGSGTSSIYPCVCGDSICTTRGEMCDASSSSCIPAPTPAPTLAFEYQRRADNGGCGLDGERWHERCVCNGGVDECKAACDNDVDCRGYVGSNEGCQYATTSECIAANGKGGFSCNKTDRGKVGPITSGGPLMGRDNFRGCEVKYLVCTSTDGDSLSDVYPCLCGTDHCYTNDICNGNTSTCSAAACSISDGSEVSEAYPCQCGDSICHDGEPCDAATSTCSPAECSVNDGTSGSESYPCSCGSTFCNDWEWCDAGSSTCKQDPCRSCVNALTGEDDNCHLTSFGLCFTMGVPSQPCSSRGDPHPPPSNVQFQPARSCTAEAPAGETTPAVAANDETKAPTAAPTAEPTAAPTAAPTAEPTAESSGDASDRRLGDGAQCIGCDAGISQFIWEQENQTIFGMLVSLVCDAGAITLTVMAASMAFGYSDNKDHVDIKFKRRAKYTKEISHFELTSPLAQDFVNEVLDNAFRDNDGTIPAARANRKLKTGKTNDTDYLKKAFKRSKNYNKLDGDEEDAANFQDVSCWEPENEQNAAGHWQEFWDQGKTVVQKDAHEKNKWLSKILIPKNCLGIMEDERVIGAWVEVPQLNFINVLPILISALLLFAALTNTDEGTKHFWRLGWWGDAHDDKNGSAFVHAISTFVIGFTILFGYLYIATKHVVILTDVRVIYVRYQAKAVLLLKFMPQLRVDNFRHDHEVSYGSFMTSPPTLYQRATRAPWTPGAVFLQPGIFGLLRMDRMRGNVISIYQVVCQLTKPGEKQFLSERAIQDAGVSVQICQQYVKDNMEKALDMVWRITNDQPDDVPGMIPDMYLTCADEKPLFYWSFQEFGYVSSAYNTNSDVVVTTDRVYLYNRSLWKPFDSKTCCCFAICWCTCLWRALSGKKYLRRQSSFLKLDMLLSFCTEVDITAPVWYDPKRWPCVCPMLDAVAQWLTMCMTCKTCKGVSCDKKTCSPVPGRSGARAQLWMMWRHRYNPTQKDLQLAIRPFSLKDPTLVADVLSTCFKIDPRQLEETSLRAEEGIDEIPDYEKVETLRKIMGVTQDIAGRSV